MKLKAVSGIMLTLLFVSMLTMAFNIQPVKASGPIYIRADGSVEGTTDISSADNVTYTFTDNIFNQSIFVEKDNIVVDGAGYTLQGTGNYTGISLVDRSNVTIKNAKITSFWHGIMLNMSSSNTMYGNTVAANNWHGIWIHESSNNTISGNNITRNVAYGILLAFSSNNIISGNVLKNNGVTGITGIRIDNYSNNNSIYSNIVTAQEYWGIELSYSSNNRISENNITNNERGVVIWFFSTNNTIDQNNIANNDYGIYRDDSSGNHVYHNNFMDNTQQVFDPYAPYEVNNWDGGYPSGGNYWSDYTGVDANMDGIGDSFYEIDSNNIDHYPLMGMFSDFNATSEHNVQTICNSSISDFQFNGTAISFNVTGETDTTGFCRICIPRALMNETYRVFVNGTEVSYDLLPCANSTHSYLYFTYNHSTQEVIIVSEFPTWTSMLLILVLLTVALAIYKRKLFKTPIWYQ